MLKELEAAVRPIHLQQATAKESLQPPGTIFAAPAVAALGEVLQGSEV